MPPIKQRELYQKLKALGFNGPVPGGKHPYFEHPNFDFPLTVPNPHRGDLDVTMQKQILKRLNSDFGFTLSNDDWLKLS